MWEVPPRDGNQDCDEAGVKPLDRRTGLGRRHPEEATGMSDQSDQQGTERAQLQGQVLERASRDQEFRSQLLENPKGALEQAFDVQIPEFIEVEVVEESPSKIYLVLPPATKEAGQELSDRDLEAVAGGWTEVTACTQCHSACAIGQQPCW
jgi:hypothetical protein